MVQCYLAPRCWRWLASFSCRSPPPPPSRPRPPKRPLYERLGGYDALSAVTKDLAGRLVADPKLARFWANRGKDGVEREVQLIVDFLAAKSGGPLYYPARDEALPCGHENRRGRLGRADETSTRRWISSRCRRRSAARWSRLSKAPGRISSERISDRPAAGRRARENDDLPAHALGGAYSFTAPSRLALSRRPSWRFIQRPHVGSSRLRDSMR